MAGVTVMANAMTSINDGRRRVKRGIEESRAMIRPMTPIDDADAEGVVRVAMMLAASDPMNPPSWDVNLAPLNGISVTHRLRWDHQVLCLCFRRLNGSL